ncbi:malto-oligosyltrehalose synthase [Microvirga massiliensis]|uniref:malto-oligosyltrehalose synthase n=1 Tax=Microvirga massiliensis TaxID=1033741 RepID=UPI00062BE8D4|nr:malto-oligosyltrehalose synthase [Microvirga massiliensis]
MNEHSDLIRRAAALVGIAADYRDLAGRTVETSLSTQAAILAGFGLEVGSPEAARRTLARLEETKHGLVAPVTPILAHRPARIPVRGAQGDAATWRITEESGTNREGRSILQATEQGPVVQISALPAGYHRLRINVGGLSGETTLIAAPRRCWEPATFREGARLWGTTAQVYSLRSSHDLGIGDYSDVAEAAAGTAALGASFLGLSPVHALFAADRSKISPYSPSSRLFLETLFIDPTTVDGFLESGGADLLNDSDWKDRLAALRETPLVDHAGVWELKRRLLDALWAFFQKTGMDPDFTAFRRRGGEALRSHATFEALSEHFRQEGRWWVGDWPDDFKRADAPEVRAFRETHAERVAFHSWLQWLADRQLGDVAERARAAGMEIGLYRDLAVGADAGGSEIWSHPDRFAPSLSAGAPPDPFGPFGQKWGLPPLNPLTLEAQGLAAFRALVAANMRHAGAIRIDHAFQLQRLFVIPSDAPATEGAYVAYPFEAMLAVLRVESHRARSLVIAEDLGTAPEGFSEAIMASGVLSYRVLWFEREEDGRFKRPRDYPRSALAVFTTHDLPTFKGWWRGLDIDLRQTLGTYDQARAEAERAGRSSDLDHFRAALAAEGLTPPPDRSDEPPLEAMMRYLTRTPSVLVGMQWEDAAGELNQANLPGLDEKYPNWQRKLGADLESILAPGAELAKLAAALASEGRGEAPRPGALASPPPRATYRLQFHEQFTFDDAARIVPYLARLGISHLYASPIQAARPGSQHGYDIVDHSLINPELGGEEGFRRLTDRLREHGLGLVLDIVPNHMGIGGSDNAWWLSVLEWGELSPHGDAFDIDWERLGANHNLIVPFLGDRYGEALEEGELRLTFDPDEGSFSVWHWEHRFPICPLSYPIVLDRALAAMADDVGSARSELMAISERLRAMDEEASAERRAAFPLECAALKERIAEAARSSPAVRQGIERALSLVNGAVGHPESFGTLHRILEAQSYRLAYWRVAASDINYRRFFDINSLAGIRIEDPDIFVRSHELIFRLVREGRVQGLRIDHIDGLADPEGYVRALQSEVGPGFYIVVEKILGPGESLRNWPIAGTTGYEALNVLDGVFVDATAAERFDQIYRGFTGLDESYSALLHHTKAELLEASFASELEVLVSDLKRLADADRRTRDYTQLAIRRALVEIIARFPVYRSYLTDAEPAPEDRMLIEETVAAAKRTSSLPDRTVHDFIMTAVLGNLESEARITKPELIDEFRRRFQQLTGPVMAKSLEDTLFYRYVRLLSLNEVGGHPDHFGVRLDEFHRFNLERETAWPHAMIATSTHDTKRGEDARTRLNALSEMPDAWDEAIERWKQIAHPLLSSDGDDVPDANDQYLLLQAILGAWPVELLGDDTRDDAIAAFRERVEEFIIKALRESKRHTSWVHQDEGYETASLRLVRGLLHPGAKFLVAFKPLARRLAFAGMLASLSRSILKCTLPGVPDLYQGTEFWDLSFVDPDNRRPVDYEARIRSLGSSGAPGDLFASWPDARIKQSTLTALLADRAESPALYANGDYRPIRAQGPRARNVLSFVRTCGDEQLAVTVPRLVGAIAEEAASVAPIFAQTSLPLPKEQWRDIITGDHHEIHGNGIAVTELFSKLPFSVLRAMT